MVLTGDHHLSLGFKLFNEHLINFRWVRRFFDPRMTTIFQILFVIILDMEADLEDLQSVSKLTDLDQG